MMTSPEGNSFWLFSEAHLNINVGFCECNYMQALCSLTSDQGKTCLLIQFSMIYLHNSNMDISAKVSFGREILRKINNV